MSEREYVLDVCPECKKLESDSSEKRLFQCPSCERWFCEKHLEPKLAVIRDFNKIIKDKEWRDIVEKDWEREDGHPDYAYTRERLDKLKIEKEIVWARINAFLDRSRVYKKPVPKETEKERLHFVKEENSHGSKFAQVKQKHGSTVGKAILVLGLIVLILGVVLIVFPQSHHEEGEFQFSLYSRPVQMFDLGTIPKNVRVNIDYDVKGIYGLVLGRIYVIIINASELLVIDQEWSKQPSVPIPYLIFRFENMHFNYYIYDGPTSNGSLSWVTPYQGQYMVLVWVEDMGGASFVYFIRINATWNPYFNEGIIVSITGIAITCIGFAYNRFRSG